ncbi:hypothetical protein ACFODL_00590 [Phenylobacterium terrae]|uniref:DUF2909 domain-containing protein n=1 Tax=Phenylobacterium terrae TaxID=2665495 RepID=A0ABW4N1D4_9CAUL
MSLGLTLALLAAAAVLAVFAGWRGARKPDPFKGPRLIPWRAIMLTSAAMALLLLVHVVNLLGVTTGR